MLLTEFETTCEKLRRDKTICREAYEKLRSAKAALAVVAQAEQEMARLQESELESIKKMTAATDELWRLLLQHMALTEEARARIGVAAPTDQDARNLVITCSRSAEFCLEGAVEALLRDDVVASRTYCEQARWLNDTLREIQESWPWIDAEGIEESWRQYERGELMDFETFKNELLKAAK